MTYKVIASFRVGPVIHIFTSSHLFTLYDKAKVLTLNYTPHTTNFATILCTPHFSNVHCEIIGISTIISKLMFQKKNIGKRLTTNSQSVILKVTATIFTTFSK